MKPSLAATLLFVATPLWAQDQPDVRYSPKDPDDLEIRESSEGHFAEIVYDNAAALSSEDGTHVLTWEGEEFIVEVEVGGQEIQGREIIRITPPDTLMAVPEYAEVPDGEIFIIQIMEPMF